MQKTEGNEIKSKLPQLEPQEKAIKAAIDQKILDLPNLPSETTPIGKDERENVEVRRWGEEYKPTNPNILPHWEIGEKLGILDFERAVKIAQSRFVNLIALGAALERALINFMLDRHIVAGYTEVLPPILINSDSLRGTGQLPKFAEESFKCRDDEENLICYQVDKSLIENIPRNIGNILQDRKYLGVPTNAQMESTTGKLKLINKMHQRIAIISKNANTIQETRILHNMLVCRVATFSPICISMMRKECELLTSP